MAEGFLDELRWRGLLHQATATDPLVAHLSTPGRIAYCGFDPTMPSLTIGNMLPILLLRRWQEAGHAPIFLMGGGTGKIGDPSGKDAERTLQDSSVIEANVAAQRKIMEQLVDLDPKRPNAGRIMNNADWLDKLGYIEVLRDIGKHFSINAMIQRDSVRERLHNREQGISYTEFSYMLLQAYDFLHLHRAFGCTVQMAGSDQYGNIVSGIDLIHRVLGNEREAYGVTQPLLMKADGKKLGKSEKGAIWLSKDRTSPYAFYQYWINSDDADVVSLLKWFTFLRQEEIERIAAEHTTAPQLRAAQRELARHVTRMVHGEDEVKKVEAASQALFSGDVRSLPEDMLSEVFADVPHSQHDKNTLSGEGASLVDVLAETTLASSKREARQFLQAGAVLVNGEKAELEMRLTSESLMYGHTILLKRGKKLWHATRWH
ncbi:MAG TPA: tyrosine--tRNA ligase [Polyangiales bacterium]|nr:tyrosine--tRNA ligase [Polyangiales bacterium]